MDVKGTFFVGRKAFITQQYGEERWARFIAALGEREPIFTHPILVTTLVPVEAYLVFQDELIREFFAGRDEAFWTIGEKSAEWALTEGPYKNFKNNPRSLKKFVEQLLPLIWSAYYTEGRLDSELDEDGTVHIRIVELPVPHVSFEYAVIGWARRAFQLLGMRGVAAQRIRGMSAGDGDIYYQISFSPPSLRGAR